MIEGYQILFWGHAFLTTQSFYRDPIFLMLVTLPLPFWTVMYIIQGALGTKDLPALWMLVLLYPLLEEIIFRGILQPFLSRFVRTSWSILSLANIITSTLFVSLHFISHPPLWALATFFPSVIFGYIQERTNNLLAPIILHCSYNAAYFVMLG